MNRIDEIVVALKASESAFAELDKMPMEWRAGRISDLVTEVTLRVDPQAVHDPDTPYIGLEDIGQGTGSLVSVGKASSAASQKSGFVAGDTLFGKLRPNLKKVVRPNFDGICSTDIAVFRAKAQIDPDFAFRVLSSDRVIEHAVAQSAGTKMPRAHARSVLNFDTLLPPLGEQRRIAEVLRCVDEATTSLQTICEAYERIRNAEVQVFARNSLEHGSLSLGEVIASMDSGWSPDCDGEPAYADEWGVLKTSAVTWEGYDDRQNKRLPSKLSPRPSLAVVRDDILITRAGPAERTGVVAIVRSTAEKRMLSDKLIRIRAASGAFEPLALSELLRCEEVQGQLRALKSGMAASQTNLTQKALRSVLIPAASAREQHEFGERISNLDAVLNKERTILSEIRKVRLSIASDLLSGRVRVPA